MSERILEYLAVFLTSSVKFIFGPIQGAAFGLGWLETAALTASGMMMTVMVFTFLGQYLRKRFYRPKKLFTPVNRRNVRLWRKYGIYGVAALTPLLLSPVGGAILANAFGEKKEKIFFWMLVSAVFWGICITLAVFGAGDWLSSLRAHAAQTFQPQSLPWF